MCPNCRAFITTDDKVCPYCEVPIGPRAIDRRAGGEILGGLIPQARFTTVMILLVNTALFVANYFAPVDQAGASLPFLSLGFNWYRWITAGFLHGGVLHILMNSWVLFDLGAEVEQFYGTSRLIFFYFIATVTGFMASSLTGHLSVGSSAGIYGLIGAMLAFGYSDKTPLGQMVKEMYGRWVVYGLVLSFIPGVDIMAHIGGFAGGFVAGYLAGTFRARLEWKETLLRGLAGASLAITVLAFAQMFRMMLLYTRSMAR